MSKQPLSPDPTNIEHAVSLLKQGGLVAFPTETVYGLGADASNPDAVKKIFSAKRRPSSHPLIVHIGHFDQLHKWAQNIPDSAIQLVDSFWPGPLAIILQKQAWVPSVVTGGQDTLALRMPNNPVALALLKQFSGGLAAPSANRFNHISPTLASHVQTELGDSVDLILDGGACQVGLESTIIDCSSREIKLLRPGHILPEHIEAVLHRPVSTAQESKIRAPGMLELHYAPTTPAFLCPLEDIEDRIDHLVKQNKSIGMLAREFQADHSAVKAIINMPVEAVPYAHDLYAQLRQLDIMPLDIIVIEQPPQHSAWAAVNDRLLKATAGNH